MPYDLTVNFNGLSFGVRFDPIWSIARPEAENRDLAILGRQRIPIQGV
jgi:hypothetical protein